MKNILFINPSRRVVAEEKDNLFTNESLTPSLGIGYLAAYCRQYGIEVDILDLRLPHRNLKNVEDFLRNKRYSMVGITAFTNEVFFAGIIAKFIKKQFPDMLIAIGGPHASIDPEGTLDEFPDFDVAVAGEGEKTLLELINNIDRKNENNFINIPGLALRKNGEILLTEKREEIEDIDILPFPAWDLFELRYYRKGLFMVMTSRGCPYNCYFCTPHYLGRKIRMRNYLKVVDEIEYINKNFKAVKIQFADAMISILNDNVSRLCDEITRRGLDKKIQWDCETRADCLDLQLLNKMKKAGCQWVAIGVETGNEKILRDIIGKQETKNHIREAVQLCKKAGIRVRCFFVLGHYTETVETIRETIRFALELNPDALAFGLLVPNPGTKIRQLAEVKTGGLHILHSRWQDYNQFNYSCMESDNLSLNDLKKWQAKAYFTFYLHHPGKALVLFLDKSGYNYKIKGILHIPWMLFKNLFSKGKK